MKYSFAFAILAAAVAATEAEIEAASEVQAQLEVESEVAVETEVAAEADAESEQWWKQYQGSSEPEPQRRRAPTPRPPQYYEPQPYYAPRYGPRGYISYSENEAAAEPLTEELVGTPFEKFDNVVQSSETDKSDDKMPNMADRMDPEKALYKDILEINGVAPRFIEKGEKREHKKVKYNEKYTGQWHDCRDDDYSCIPDVYEQCKFPETDHFDSPDYQAQSAFCKCEQIWRKIVSDTEVRERFFTGNEFQSLFDQDMNLTYDVITDTMPVNRKKVTHPVGVHTKVEFIAHPDSPYTGIFRGAKHGVMRISETVKTSPSVGKTAPGFGIKFLRDGMYSANFVTMFSFDG